MTHFSSLTIPLFDDIVLISALSVISYQANNGNKTFNLIFKGRNQTHFLRRDQNCICIYCGSTNKSIET